MTGNVGIAGGSSGVSNGATGRTGIKNLPTGANPIDAARGLAAARRSAGARQRRRLSGRYQADLFGRRRPVQSVPPTSTRWCGALDGVEFLVAQDHFLTPTARYADIVLPATTFWERNDVHTPWAGRRSLRHLHAPGDRADVRMPQRHRHLCRPRGPRRHRRLQRQDRAGVAARADQRRRRRLRCLRRERRCPVRRAPRMRWPSPRRSATPSATGSRRPPARSRSTRWRSPPSPTPTVSGTSRPIPTWMSPFEASTPLSAQAVHAEIARPHPLDPRQPAEAGARRSRRCLAASRGCAPRAASPTASACASSTIAAPPCCRRASPIASRAAPYRSRKAPGSPLTPTGTDTQGMRQRAHRRPLGTVRGNHLQHQPGGGGALGGSAISEGRDGPMLIFGCGGLA